MRPPDDPALRHAKKARLEAHLRWELVRAALLDQEPELRCHARTLRAYDDLHGRGRDDNPTPCSRCGRDLAAGDGETGDSFRLVFGYGSRFDLEEWFVSLCDDCCAGFVDWVSAGEGTGVHRIGWDGAWKNGPRPVSRGRRSQRSSFPSARSLPALRPAAPPVRRRRA